MYSEKVMDHFQHPRNVGEIENASGVGTVGNAKCGDIMRIYFDIDDMQQNMIRSHMFPVFLERPKYKESVALTIADKVVATHEMYRYKLAATLGIWMIFLFNVISIQKWS